MRLHLALASVASAAALASPASALTPISGSTQIGTQAFVNFLAASETDADEDHWVGAPENLSVFAVSDINYQNDMIGSSAATAFGATSATWSPDGSSGSVRMNWGWGFSQAGGDGTPDTILKGATFVDRNPNWSYAFLADRDGILRWQGQVRPDRFVLGNNPFGLSGWNLQLNGLTVIDLFDVTGAGPRLGDRDFALVGGETYTFSLVNTSNIAGSNFGRDYRGRMRGEFFWDILETPTAPVPEPDTWALIIAGFGAVGAMLRRRQASVIETSRSPKSGGPSPGQNYRHRR